MLIFEHTHFSIRIFNNNFFFWIYNLEQTLWMEALQASLSSHMFEKLTSPWCLIFPSTYLAVSSACPALCSPK